MRMPSLPNFIQWHAACTASYPGALHDPPSHRTHTHALTMSDKAPLLTDKAPLLTDKAPLLTASARRRVPPGKHHHAPRPW